MCFVLDHHRPKVQIVPFEEDHLGSSDLEKFVLPEQELQLDFQETVAGCSSVAGHLELLIVLDCPAFLVLGLQICDSAAGHLFEGPSDYIETTAAGLVLQCCER